MFLIITGFMLKPISSACCPTTKWYYKIYNTRNFRWPGIAFKVTSLCKPVESSLLIHTSCLISEKAMVTHSSTLAWKIPWMEEPGRLQSMGSQRVGLRDFTFTFHSHALEKEMATHSSVLAWRIPGMGEPGESLRSMGSHRVRHD